MSLRHKRLEVLRFFGTSTCTTKEEKGPLIDTLLSSVLTMQWGERVKTKNIPNVIKFLALVVNCKETVSGSTLLRCISRTHLTTLSCQANQYILDCLYFLTGLL